MDYLWKDGKTNCSKIVDKGIKGAKLAELHYQVVENKNIGSEECCLTKITLKTGRHHQIRVQMAGHGTPLWGDRKYNPMVQKNAAVGNVALFAYSLSFSHPVTKKRLGFSVKPKGEVFEMFSLSGIA